MMNYSMWNMINSAILLCVCVYIYVCYWDMCSDERLCKNTGT